MTPEINIGFRYPEILTSLMAMPEATVNKDNSPVFFQDYIRRPRQLPAVHAIPQPPGEKILPHNHLRLSILPLYSGHIPAPFLIRLYIRHSYLVLSRILYNVYTHIQVQRLGHLYFTL